MRISDIIDFLDRNNYEFKFDGNSEAQIYGFSSLGNYREDTLTWCKSAEYIKNADMYGHKFGLIIIPESMEKSSCKGNVILTENPKKIFFDILDNLFARDDELPPVGEGSYISKNVKLGKNVKIGYNCVLDGDIVIDDNTVIYNNVSIINRVKIGRNCIIHSGTVIGHDDFSYTEDENHVKTMIRHYGGVVIEDDVFIGANSVINRATIDDTLIGKGTKIDAFCHISHNSVIGANSSLISGSRLYGSVTTGENVYIASATVKNQLHIGDNALIGMGSIVLDNVNENSTVVGVPAKEKRLK